MEALLLVNERWQAVYDKKTDRILGRLKRGTDVIEGIKEICAHFGVTAGQFQCMGSLNYVTYMQAERADDKGNMKYSPIMKTNSGVELVTATGFIGTSEETNELEIHLHGAFVDCDHQFSAGHFIEGGNPTAVTVEYLIHVVHDADVKRSLDRELNIPFFQFHKKEASD